MRQPTKVIITGATGTIGTALLRYCDKNKITAYAIVRPESKRIHQIPNSPYIHVISCALGDYRQLLEIEECKYADAFFHLAWSATFGEGRNDAKLQTKNAEYAIEAMQVANELMCSCFLFAGSQAEYGRTEEKLNATIVTNPDTEYGRAKLYAGREMQKLCKSLKMRFIYTRILSVYGPYDGEKTMVTSTIHKLLHNCTPEFTKAEQKWDYLYSDDAAEALFLLVQSGREDTIYCIGSGEEHPLYEYIETIKRVVNPNINLNLGSLPYRENQVMYLCADITDLTRDTGFVPKVSFEEGISRIVREIKD